MASLDLPRVIVPGGLRPYAGIERRGPRERPAEVVECDASAWLAKLLEDAGRSGIEVKDEPAVKLAHIKLRKRAGHEAAGELEVIA